MTSRDFAYWLQGYFEISLHSPDGRRTNLSADQVACIQQHLAMVFKHEIDPSAGPPEHQAELDAIHHGPSLEVKNPQPIIGGVGPHGLVYRC